MSRILYIRKLVLYLCLLPTILFGADWSTTHISYLYGQDYRNPANDNVNDNFSIYTLEHVSGWKYGDNFFFIDAAKTDTKNSDLYLEFAPRFSATKILGHKYEGYIQDILLATQINIAQGAGKKELAGLGVDFKLPYFDMFQTNLYHRDDKDLNGSTYQLTFVWESNFKLFNQGFKFLGFLDIAGEEGSDGAKSEANTLAQPQLLWMAYKNLGIGLEYQYWENKYGINGLDESLPQLLVRWTL